MAALCDLAKLNAPSMNNRNDRLSPKIPPIKFWVSYPIGPKELPRKNAPIIPTRILSKNTKREAARAMLFVLLRLFYIKKNHFFIFILLINNSGVYLVYILVKVLK